jgi:hypothetical protein
MCGWVRLVRTGPIILYLKRVDIGSVGKHGFEMEEVVSGANSEAEMGQ